MRGKKERARYQKSLSWRGVGMLPAIGNATLCRDRRGRGGCEQGDALAPALFALAQHAALVAASQQLRPGEFPAAFLDALCIVTVPNRARAALEAVSSAVEELAVGKTRVYNRAGGAAPPGFLELGPEAWRGDKPPSARPSARRSTLPRARGSAWSRSRACWRSCHSCLTCSVPGCCSSFAPRLGRNTCSAPCRLPNRRQTRKHMTMRSGAHCERSSASAAPLGRRPASLLFFQRATAALVSCVPHALRLPPTGRPGAMCARGAAVAGDLLRRHWPSVLAGHPCARGPSRCSGRQ